ncbi:hypothetical protein GCM10023205_26050 [Yinghuangia aomiensis]|uniref:Uncharacterized protein n=1 Tax=Yinghuangia aomiensis TaxID=676205 RepID=A0ABP9H6J8_9ACTN
MIALLLALAFSVLDIAGPAARASSADDSAGGPRTTAVSVAALTPASAADEAAAFALAADTADESLVPSPAADTADEAVRTLPVRAPIPPHAGAPHAVALPAPADPWHVLAAGGPPGFRTPERAARPLVPTAPRADRAPPAPAGI